MLIGGGFSQRSATLGCLRARFNATSVPLAWASSSELRCVAPPHAAGVVSVEVTQNEQQHTASGVRFEYEDAGAIRIDPTSGPVRGGTMVLVRGAGHVGAAPALSLIHI